jgi:hypothetical protein
VGLFSSLIYNTPESMLESKIVSKGHIEYQFKTFGEVTVLFIKVKLFISSLCKHLNCIVQVVAEADGVFDLLILRYKLTSLNYMLE